MLSPKGLCLGQNLGRGGFCSPESTHTPSTLLQEHCSVLQEAVCKEPTWPPLQNGNSEQTKIQPVYPLFLYLPPSLLLGDFWKWKRALFLVLALSNDAATLPTKRLHLRSPAMPAPLRYSELSSQHLVSYCIPRCHLFLLKNNSQCGLEAFAGIFHPLSWHS